MGAPASQIALYRFLLVVALLVLWEGATGGLVSSLVLVDPFFISSPRRIALDLAEGFSRGTMLRDTMVTLVESIYGLALGMTTGVAAGLALAFWRSLDRLLAPFIGIANSIPRPALAPLAILWFGLGIASKVFIAWSLVFFVTFYSTY
jgi:NitT/TauT family transport system permease protein